jgi:hypothetical protein
MVLDAAPVIEPEKPYFLPFAAIGVLLVGLAGLLPLERQNWVLPNHALAREVIQGVLAGVNEIDFVRNAKLHADRLGNTFC